ncbi:hypothetical protein FYJ34_05645 [Clostridiaceae bacterium 68-1-5]|uniref:Uncharacterized protein n=1 Tax=Suipraeoptans intestinalis TaxID=2606628 RepID=A0A6N7USL6_9FIRM|nr:hypothetical protein [Suipraeoptans intestinalis]MSR93758.1 hypothetical protein [Suipraeoptans intestinalis]
MKRLISAACVAAFLVALGVGAQMETGAETKQKMKVEQTEKKKEEKKTKNKVEVKKEEAADKEEVEAVKEEEKKAEVSSTEGSEKKKEAEKAGGTGVEAKQKESAKSAETSGSGNTSQTEPKAHSHNWQPVYTTITVTDQAAWTEQVPVYRQEAWKQCNTCGADITGQTSRQHEEATGCPCGGYGTAYRQVLDHYNTINHPAVTHQEQQITGYRCSCGATQ